MRVAVVGGSGFVGGHVVDKLMKAGHDVVIADSRPPKWHPSQMFHEVDVLDQQSLVDALAGTQVVMHLAAVSNTQAAVNDPVMATRINCEGTTKVLQAARTVSAERVVVAGSSLISGQQVHRPQDGTIHGEFIVDEFSPLSLLEADHPYVVSKAYAEMIARVYSQQYGLPVTIFRYGIQYGERMTPGVVFHTFIERALQGRPLMVHGNGEQWRQYVYVGDIADAHVAVIDRWDDSANRTFSLVGEEKVRIIDIAEAVARHIPVEIEFGPERKGDIEVKFCRYQEAEAGLGWKAKTTLDQGVAKTIDWYKKHLSSGIRRK